MENWFATVEESLKSRWIVVEAGGMIGDSPAEDMSIATEHGKEVVGCSEGMRAYRHAFDHIVALHNAWLQNAPDHRRDERKEHE